MLFNRYFVLRHGRSIANEENIIISHPANGIAQYGLSASGFVRTAQKLQPMLLKEFDFHASNSLCITSDFRRSFETAQIFCWQFNLAAPRVDTRLRERFFGDFERTDTANYQRVWSLDNIDARQTQFGCESTEQVLVRLLALIRELESNFSQKKIVLVSHGDPLQILEAWFSGLPCNAHRQLRPLKNAELRFLRENIKREASLPENEVAVQEKIIREPNRYGNDNF